MIDLYTWGTPNGHKAAIMLEETGLAYRVHPIDIGRGDQFEPGFLRISPNNKIPAIVDDHGPDGAEVALFESGAILVYLADKARARGKVELLPSGTARYAALAWLFFQVGHIGPMLGQLHHFLAYAPERIPYAIERYTKEARRLYRVLDERLAESPYLGGPTYGIADIANFAWTRQPEKQGIDGNAFPHVTRWLGAIEARPAVQRGLAIPRGATAIAEELDERRRAVLFGEIQHTRGAH
jgi:GST-like protein